MGDEATTVAGVVTPTWSQVMSSLSLRLRLAELSRKDALCRLAAAEAAHDALWDEHLALKQCAAAVEGYARTLVADIDAYDTLLTDQDEAETLVKLEIDSGTATAIDALLERDARIGMALATELDALADLLASSPSGDDAEGGKE